MIPPRKVPHPETASLSKWRCFLSKCHWGGGGGGSRQSTRHAVVAVMASSDVFMENANAGGNDTQRLDTAVLRRHLQFYP